MNHKLFVPVWNCPATKSVLASATKVADFLRKDYGIPVVTTNSEIPNHLSIAVPPPHARRATHLCELRFGRAY